MRLLLDAVGSMQLSSRSLSPLLAAGVQVAWFMPVLHRPFRGRTNLRNHRKAVIVDSSRVWCGGRNTSSDYLSTPEVAAPWADLTCTVEGHAVSVYGDVFESDWSYASKTTREKNRSLPSPDKLSAVGINRIQVVPSGPDLPNDPLLTTIVSTIYNASQRIWLVSP